MESRLEALRHALSRAQSAADALAEDPHAELGGVGYFADAAESGLQDAIEQIAAHEGEITVFVGAGVSQEASPWIAVAAAINGAPVEQDPAVYTSRWRLVRGLPVAVAATTTRSVAGVLTLTSTVPLAHNPLARRNAPAGLLAEMDDMLVDAAAALFQ